MLTTEHTSFMSRIPPKVVHTHADSQCPVTPSKTRDDRAGLQQARAGWQRLIDFSLIQWGRDPERFDEEGMAPPDGQIIRLAIDLAERFRDEGLPPPDSVVPDPNGGIVFERRENGESEVFHIWDDGTVEYLRFHGTRLAYREPLRF